MPNYDTARRYHRDHIEWDTRWNAFGKLEDGMAMDISAAGVFVASARGGAVRPGSRIQLWLKMANRQRVIHVTGTVRWSGVSATHNKPGFGVQFDQVQFTIGAFLHNPDVAKALEKLRGA